MGKEIDHLINYPRATRNIKLREAEKTEQDRLIARKFGKDFFDGDRRYGYGGFNYNPKYWELVIPSFQNYYKLNKNSTILDIGCAKGFMMHDFKKIIPGIKIKGVDISEYAINNCINTVKNDVMVADARNLPFESNSFDLVISITTIHNFEIDDCKKALKEISRISKKNSFITVDAYRNDKEKETMLAWNLTAKTILHVNEWKNLFKSTQYSGDYYWFMP